jgi:hypothetical protein
MLLLLLLLLMLLLLMLLLSGISGGEVSVVQDTLVLVGAGPLFQKVV